MGYKIKKSHKKTYSNNVALSNALISIDYIGRCKSNFNIDQGPDGPCLNIGIGVV